MSAIRMAAVRILVWDLAESVAFYRTNFGWPVQAGSAEAGFCVFDVGGASLIVEPVSLDADPEDQSYVGRFTGISFRVDDIASVYGAMRANGVVFAGEPEKQFWGGMIATLYDPAGNQVQIVEYPKP